MLRRAFPIHPHWEKKFLPDLRLFLTGLITDDYSATQWRVVFENIRANCSSNEKSCISLHVNERLGLFSHVHFSFP